MEIIGDEEMDDEKVKKMVDSMRKEYIKRYGQVDWFDEMELVKEVNSGDDFYDLWENIFGDSEDREEEQ